MTNQSIFLADDHPVLLKGLQDYLLEQGYMVAGVATAGIAAYHSIIRLKPAIAILDIEMPGMNGMEIAEKLRGTDVLIIFITIHKDASMVNRAMQLGVKGYLLKEYALEEINRCIAEVIAGRTFYGKELQGSGSHPHNDSVTVNLSPSEKKILKLIAEQKNTREIASALFISDRTVEKHRSNIIRKLGLAHSQNSLLTWALQNRDRLTGKGVEPNG